jgi:muramidase (phage lysozyme)
MMKDREVNQPQNRKAFLDTIAVSELGPDLLKKSDDGYNVIVGSTAAAPILFTSYGDHPRRLVELKDRKGNVIVKSTAAGRYQILSRYFDAYKRLLGLKDFLPASQDAIALQMIKEQTALADVDAGRFAIAIDKCRNIWASLPGAGYGQHENKLAELQMAFVAAGGRVLA